MYPSSLKQIVNFQTVSQPSTQQHIIDISYQNIDIDIIACIQHLILLLWHLYILQLTWVVEEAVNNIRSDLKLENVSLCDKFRDLPSVQASEVKLRPTYSLFRLDYACSRATGLSLVRTRSDIFGFLDPKDSLCRICQLLSVTKFMPETLLIPWNWSISSIDTDLYSQIVENLRHGPKLLKAPLGSGGFGLYFVHSVRGETLFYYY